jgi:parallel beta-helix repeat protein
MSPYISLSGTIPASGYFLIERKIDGKDSSHIFDANGNSMADFLTSFSYGLNNNGENLILSRASTTVDQVPYCNNWCGGSADPYYYTMERYDYDVFGSDTTNWSRNNEIIKNGKDAGNNVIRGTPKARNSLNYLIAKGATVSSSITLETEKSPYLVNNQNQIFQSNAVLTVEPGVVVKFYNDAGLKFSGNAAISVQGTAQNPVVFTSFTDDSYGGDTDATSTTPAPGAWFGVSLESTNSSSVVDNAVFRYGGKYYTGQGQSMANLSVSGNSSTITNSIFEQSNVYGLKLSNSSSTVSCNTFRNNNYIADPAGLNSAIYVLAGGPTVSNNTINQNKRGIYLSGSSAAVNSNSFNSNTQEAIYSSGLLGTFANNSGSSNGTNGIIFSSVNANATLKSNSLPYVLTTNITVATGVTLSVDSGVAIKGSGGHWGGRLDVYGNLLVNGSTAGDVVFSSNSGSPNKGDWQGIRMYSSSSSNIKGATISYAEKGIVYESSPLNLENVRLENNTLGIQADAGSSTAGVATSTVEFVNNTTNTSPAGLW